MKGEFSKRAVLNNKIDLLQAEAINELIHANSQQILKQSLLNYKAVFHSILHVLKKISSLLLHIPMQVLSFLMKSI